MHGIIFGELAKYVEKQFGGDAWQLILASTGLSSRMYVPIKAYPDEELEKIVATASKMTGRSPETILLDFGEFIAPHLLGMYGSLLKPAWRTLDVVENTETTIHRVIRMRQPEAAPPYLSAKRTAANQVTLLYNSPRRLCAVAKGIVHGMATHFGELVSIREPSCMHKGAAECVLVIERAKMDSNPDF